VAFCGYDAWSGRYATQMKGDRSNRVTWVHLDDLSGQRAEWLRKARSQGMPQRVEPGKRYPGRRSSWPYLTLKGGTMSSERVNRSSPSDLRVTTTLGRILTVKTGPKLSGRLDTKTTARSHTQLNKHLTNTQMEQQMQCGACGQRLGLMLLRGCHGHQHETYGNKQT
jgi:hypothetical protein